METDSKSTAPQANRRSSRRLAASSAARIECRKGSLGLGPNLAVSFLDISETGIRLVLKSALAKGQEVEVLLQGGGVPRPIKRLARVVWSLEVESGGWCVGLRFDRALPYIDMQRLTRALR
jgi:hypothetical protein